MEASRIPFPSALLAVASPARRRSPHMSPRVVAAAARGGNYGQESGRRFVDADMSVLRRRIKELEIAESRHRDAADSGDDEDSMAPLPDGWMGWEKQYYYERHASDAAATAAAVEATLLGTRPLVSLGLMGLVLLSIPTTGVLVLLRLVDLVKVMLGSGISP